MFGYLKTDQLLIEETMFQSATKDKMSTHIIRQVREAILKGELQTGQCLPSEKELIIQFGVSKHTLREALRTLEAMGFIEIKRGAGGGPVVSEVDMKTTRDSIANFLHFQNVSVSSLSEVRKILEPYLARKAAETFSAQEIEILEGIDTKCQAIFKRDKNIVGTREEIDFHVFLAKASRNPVMEMILDFVNSVLTDIKSHMKPGIDFSEHVLASHQKVLKAIKAGDADGAEQAMYQHICQVEEELADLSVEKKPTFNKVG
jgi:GntR family transcriptional repressor for pyruvate dehydrogenase complex